MSTADWTIVAVAGVLASATAGVGLTWSVWSRGTGWRLVPGLLTLHAGAALVVGTVATSAAVRSWQLVDRPPDEQAAAALLDVSRTDGDTSMYALLVLLLVAVTGLATLLLALAARFAATTHPLERAIACTVLGLEIGASGWALALVVGGSRSVAVLVGLGHLPLLMAAMVATWPPRDHAPIRSVG